MAIGLSAVGGPATAHARFALELIEGAEMRRVQERITEMRVSAVALFA